MTLATRQSRLSTVRTTPALASRVPSRPEYLLNISRSWAGDARRCTLKALTSAGSPATRFRITTIDEFPLTLAATAPRMATARDWPDRQAEAPVLPSNGHDRDPSGAQFFEQLGDRGR